MSDNKSDNHHTHGNHRETNTRPLPNALLYVGTTDPIENCNRQTLVGNTPTNAMNPVELPSKSPTQQIAKNNVPGSQGESNISSSHQSFVAYDQGGDQAMALNKNQRLPSLESDKCVAPSIENIPKTFKKEILDDGNNHKAQRLEKSKVANGPESDNAAIITNVIAFPSASQADPNKTNIFEKGMFAF